MIDLDEIKQRIRFLTDKFGVCLKALEPDKLAARREELNVLQQDADLYKDLSRAQRINSEAKQLDGVLEDLRVKQEELDSLGEFVALLGDEYDDSLAQELITSLEKLEKEVETLNLSTLLKGEYDHNNAIMTIHAGAGGTEAMDWTDMLYRMYRMYADKTGFVTETVDRLDGDEAGIKSITFFVRGRNAYGYLKAEKGVHRLVRISPFDANARRHTSFASVEVMPEIEDDTDVKINPDELRIDTYRSGGAGGQHVNKTDSAVRITHLPTGIVVQCQNERSQIQNRETAMRMLKAKLAELKERELAEKASSIKGELKKIEWGSQIRSYVFQPYTLVKDHRTGYEDSDVSSVMNGNIEEFIFDYLRKS